ncbi:MAG: hypothetical protein Q8O30_01540 [Candidatus Omnitrophota bacterium]|nr:hypothetical protein [Candidatus Omnitrophota bacterium]
MKNLLSMHLFFRNINRKPFLCFLSILFLAAFLLLCFADNTYAWEGDVHFYWTYYLALHLGYTPRQAFQIAGADFAFDLDSHTGPMYETNIEGLIIVTSEVHRKIGTFGGIVDFTPSKYKERWANYHGFRVARVSQEEAEKLHQQARNYLWGLAKKERNPGPYIHLLQDYYSHFAYDTVSGHLSDGHKTDYIGNDFEKSKIMTIATTEALSRFMREVLGKEPKAIPHVERILEVLKQLSDALPAPTFNVLERYDLGEDYLNIMLGKAQRIINKAVEEDMSRGLLPRWLVDTEWKHPQWLLSPEALRYQMDQALGRSDVLQYKTLKGFEALSGDLRYNFDEKGRVQVQLLYAVEDMSITLGKETIEAKMTDAYNVRIVLRLPYKVSGMKGFLPFLSPLPVVEIHQVAKRLASGLLNVDAEPKVFREERTNGEFVTEISIDRPLSAFEPQGLVWECTVYAFGLAPKIIQVDIPRPGCPELKNAEAELSALKQKGAEIGPGITTLQNAHAQGSKVEAELNSLSATLENLRLKASALSEDCAKKGVSLQETQRIKSSLAESGEKVSLLRKTADGLAVVACELADKAKQENEAKKYSNYAYNSGQFAHQARKKAEEASALAKQAAASAQKFASLPEIKLVDELRAEINSISAKLKEQRSAVDNLASLQFNTDLTYGSMQALLKEADKVLARALRLPQSCPNDSSAQGLIKETESACGAISDAHKQATNHYNALTPIIQTCSTKLSQNENLINAAIKSIEKCEAVEAAPGAQDLDELKASIDTIEVFAQAASEFAAKAEGCASGALALSLERQQLVLLGELSPLELTIRILPDKPRYYPDETLTGTAWVRGGQPPYKSFGKYFGSGKKPEDIISFKWEAEIGAKPEEVGKFKKFAVAVYDAAGKRLQSNTIEVMIVARELQPEPRPDDEKEKSGQKPPPTDCTSCAYQNCPACAGSMIIICTSADPDCQACIEANCR